MARAGGGRKQSGKKTHRKERRKTKKLRCNTVTAESYIRRVARSDENPSRNKPVRRNKAGHNAGDDLALIAEVFGVKVDSAASKNSSETPTDVIGCVGAAMTLDSFPVGPRRSRSRFIVTEQNDPEGSSVNSSPTGRTCLRTSASEKAKKAASKVSGSISNYNEEAQRFVPPQRSENESLSQYKRRIAEAAKVFEESLPKGIARSIKNQKYKKAVRESKRKSIDPGLPGLKEILFKAKEKIAFGEVVSEPPIGLRNLGQKLKARACSKLPRGISRVKFIKSLV